MKKNAENNLLLHESHLWEQGYQFVAGVDEAGRGPLAGPVCAAAVIFPSNCRIPGITDSKKLSAAKREYLFDIIQTEAMAFGIAFASIAEIDTLNILQATYLAMNRALAQLNPQPDFVLIDGNRLPKNEYAKRALIRGDSLSQSIAAASILAKVSRDRLMVKYAEKWPQYGFEQHKGYGTKAHRLAIQQHGRCPIHRTSFSFKPVEE